MLLLFFCVNSGSYARKLLRKKEYIILSILDRRTCDICGSQDTNHYKIKDAKIGVNMPSFHSNCRCTTTVYFEDDDLTGERMMRDNKGKSVKTDYMNYDEWKQKYVDKVDENADKVGIKDIREVHVDIPFSEIDNFFNSQESYREWKNNLTEDEKYNIKIYTSNEYVQINKLLRNGVDGFVQKTWECYDFDKGELPFIQKRAEQTLKEIEEIKKGITKFKTEKSFKVYRCTSVNQVDYYKELAVEQEVILDKGFMSTSLSKKATESFADEGKTYIFEIIVPSGYQNGAYIAEFSYFPKEKEFLFNSSAMFKVIDIVEGDITKIILEALK